MNTNSIKCVIIEDEQHTARLMEDYVSRMQALELIGIFLSPIELLNFNRLNEVQLIFLDIQTPEMTGIELLKSIPIDAEVIFTTAYSQYALDGYELNVTDYLLKPVELPRFIQATNKAIDNIKLKLRKEPSHNSDFLLLKVDKKLVKVFIDEIVYIQSDWNYLHVYTKQTRLVVLSTMKNIEDSLSAYNFFRIHKSYLVNLDYFEYMEGNIIQVKGVKLQVSRGYKNELMKKLGTEL